MRRIGTVTFFKNYNYGSVLQCYAMQQVLKQFDIQAVALNQAEYGLSWKVKKIFRIIGLGFSVIKYPDRVKAVIKSRKEAARSCSSISEKTKETFDSFIDTYIMYEDRSYTYLKKSKEYSFYISGSDQVWGTSGYFLNPFMFLCFAKPEQRYSYAASFGSDECPVWYRSRMKKYLSGYKRLSVRENKGAELIKSFGLKAEINVDPTLLIRDEQWRRISVNTGADNCLFLYFLNEPSELAIEHINNLLARNKIKRIVAAPYLFDVYSKLNADVEIPELSPEEFLGAVENSCIVCTDSFHGSVFSLIFQKNFFVYYRQYTHGILQNNRIDTFLEHFDLKNQLILSPDYFGIPDFEKTNKILSEDRKHSLEYIKDIVKDMGECDG